MDTPLIIFFKGVFFVQFSALTLGYEHKIDRMLFYYKGFIHFLNSSWHNDWKYARGVN